MILQTVSHSLKVQHVTLYFRCFHTDFFSGTSPLFLLDSVKLSSAPQRRTLLRSFYRQRPFSAQILLSFFHCSHLHRFHSQPFRRFLGRQQNPVFFIICAHTEASTIVCSLHILTEFKLSITLTSWSYLMTSLREFPFLVCRLTNVYHKDFLNWAFDNNYTHNPSVNYQQTVGTACFSGLSASHSV